MRKNKLIPILLIGILFTLTSCAFWNNKTSDRTVDYTYDNYSVNIDWDKKELTASRNLNLYGFSFDANTPIEFSRINDNIILINNYMILIAEDGLYTQSSNVVGYWRKI